ncbi:helix-turn-helix transcriptional regulator [Actibacterium sp. XHP0104]|uniref:helix-turn-helix transcriptional regulator n=1 Tax=Actibacterium sp. XHP0104 TaxID=2984335 RepID=UPI0021E97AA6|nr:helix-turn-helix transcriptional regulator [Actibacterium sp. XHP0104]MCV2881309.1 helix-turn-helix transcriptional regulator [Actibacterium sp. XHP0104]
MSMRSLYADVSLLQGPRACSILCKTMLVPMFMFIALELFLLIMPPQSGPMVRIAEYLHWMSIVLVMMVYVVWVRGINRNAEQISQDLSESLRQQRDMKRIVRGHLDVEFDRWNLSAAERDVALLSLKGLKISQIAEFRQTREGTVKAQLNAIFRKAGVSSRPELLAQCLDVILELGADGCTDDLCVCSHDHRDGGPCH